MCATIDNEVKVDDGKEEHTISIYNAYEYLCGMQLIQVGSRI
jgi:hypothetical protein